MAIALALLLMAAPDASPPAAEPFDLATVGQPQGADAIVAAERAAVTAAGRQPCPEGSDGEIVVCARRAGPSPRLPLPDERFADGEVVRYADEPNAPDADPAGRSCARPGSCEPSKLGQTVGKIVNWLGGNDPR